MQCFGGRRHSAVRYLSRPLLPGTQFVGLPTGAIGAVKSLGRARHRVDRAANVDGPSLRAKIREQFNVLLRTRRTPHRRTCTFVNVLTKICIQPREPFLGLARDGSEATPSDLHVRQRLDEDLHTTMGEFSSLVQDVPSHLLDDLSSIFLPRGRHFLEDAHTGYHVLSTEPLTQIAIPEELRRSLTSPAQSASVITTTDPCGTPANPRTSRLQPTIMLHDVFPIKYLSKRLELISSRVVAVPT